MTQRTDAKVIHDHQQYLDRQKELKAAIRKRGLGKKGSSKRQAAILRAVTTPLTDKQREQGRGA